MSATPEPDSQTDAFSVETPSDSDASADVIFQTCDDCQFRVRRAVITLVSPVFDDMFSMPQPSDTNNSPQTEDLPIVHLTETGPTIDILLRLCYPFLTPPLELQSDDITIGLHSAALKYNIKQVEMHLQPLRLQRPKYLLFLYQHSCDHHEEQEANKMLLDLAFKNLVVYLQSVFECVTRYLYDWASVRNDIGMRKLPDCPCVTASSNVKWWQTVTENYVFNVTKIGPLRTCPERTDIAFCGKCKSRMFSDWRKFTNGLKRGAGREAEKVKFVPPW